MVVVIAVVGIIGGAAAAIGANASTTGSAMNANFRFVDDGTFRSSSIDVFDTRCDGHAARGNFQSVDSYGDIHTYSNHTNENGCNTSVRWADLTGSNSQGVFRVRIRAHTLDTSHYGYSPWYENPEMP